MMLRRRRWFFRFLVLSAAIHLLLIVLLFPVVLRKWRTGVPQQPVVTVSMLRLQKRPSPKPIPTEAPAPQPTAKPTPEKPIVHHAAPAPAHVARAHAPRPRVVPPHLTHLQPSQIARDEAAFTQTISKARTAQNPVTGSETAVVPETIKHQTFAASSIATVPSAGEGYLSPVRRWVDGDLVYYYVRYSVTYPDGTMETGIVPWPIHFPLHADPFARGLRSMPLPGPSPDYVASADTSMHPLVKNCYDHHYDYCPIAREGETQ